MAAPAREGNLEATTRHPLDWRNPDFYSEASLCKEMERVFDICHGCRRCVSLCQSFPKLFDLVDESESVEVDGVKKSDYWKVVGHCYLCDLCFMTKCPYVLAHEWNLDFPYLMLRAKAVHFRKGGAMKMRKLRDRVLTRTDAVGRLAGIPALAKLVDDGWDLTALIPSCVLMFKQELPLTYPDGPDVRKVKNAFLDPFEYRMLRHGQGRLNTDFKLGLGKVAYHAACHQRVQNIGPMTREALSDCAMAGRHIAHARNDGSQPEHPITLLRKAFGL